METERIVGEVALLFLLEVEIKPVVIPARKKGARVNQRRINWERESKEEFSTTRGESF